MITSLAAKVGGKVAGYAASRALDKAGVSFMLVLGVYRFSVTTAAYQKFTNNLTYLWPTQQRFGGEAKPQFTGIGERKRTLSGTIYPDYNGGLYQIDLMAAQAGLGIPLILVSGLGQVMGYWCITSISETASVFHKNGKAKKIEFDLELLYYGDRFKED